MRFDESLLVIEMSIVRPPFLLDFAAATLDVEPDFPEGTLDDWWVLVGTGEVGFRR